MKKSCFVATIVATVFAIAATEVAAQQPRPSGPVAVIDVAYVFKHHVRLQTLTNDLQRDIQAAETEVQNAKQAFESLQARMADLKKGSPEYKSLEEEMAKRQADLSIQINIQKRNFVEQQARMYSSVYKELSDVVKQHCEANGIALVMRFSGDPPDYNDPEEIFRDLNKTVIYYNTAIDITPHVLRAMNASMGSVTPTATPPGAGQLPGASRPGIPHR